MPELSAEDIKKMKHHVNSGKKFNEAKEKRPMYESQLTCYSWCCKCGYLNEANSPVCAACGGDEYKTVLYAVLS
jgi:hypothetical protein